MDKELNIGGLSFTMPELGKEFFSVAPRTWSKKIDKDHFIIKTVNTIFDKKNFAFPHIPILIDAIEQKKKFSLSNNIRVLDCPIKFPGNAVYRVPNELAQFEEAICKIVSYEHTINPNAKDYYAYITVDQKPLKAFSFQRTPGCHVDGFQGAKFVSKKYIARSYIAYDTLPTIFYAQGFRTDYLSEATDNFFLAFDDQAEEGSIVKFDPYNIILMNAYTVHMSDLCYLPTKRSFLRITFDTAKYDRLGNTKNNCFDYSWSMSYRNTLERLRHKKLPNYENDAF
jgi:hypothetical protein